MARPTALALSGYLVGAALVLALAAPTQAAEPLLLARDRPSPQRLEEAAAHPVYNAVLERYLARESAEVVLAHPGGAKGSAWADEVSGWLITLGIPGPRIRMAPGVTDPGRLRIQVGSDG